MNKIKSHSLIWLECCFLYKLKNLESCGFKLSISLNNLLEQYSNPQLKRNMSIFSETIDTVMRFKKRRSISEVQSHLHTFKIVVKLSRVNHRDTSIQPCYLTKFWAFFVFSLMVMFIITKLKEWRNLRRLRHSRSFNQHIIEHFFLCQRNDLLYKIILEGTTKASILHGNNLITLYQSWLINQSFVDVQSCHIIDNNSTFEVFFFMFTFQDVFQ